MIDSTSLRVGIVGCGRIANHHLRFISALEEVEVVGLADTNLERARFLANLSGVQGIFGSLTELLDTVPLDVLHILTPPEHHYEQTLAAINRGVSVFVEKPIALSAREVVEMYGRASQKGVALCPDFIDLFHPLTRRLINLVESGSLGRPVQFECMLGPDMDTREVREAKYLHWSYELPGGVLHNNITHPLYLALYWIGNLTQVTVHPRSFGTLPQGLTDHLEVLLEGELCNANLTLSGVIKPPPYSVRLYCEAGNVTVDFSSLTLVVEPDRNMPWMLGRFVSGIDRARQLLIESAKNALGVLRKTVVPYQGLQLLIPMFYESVRTHSAPPISQELAVAVSQAEEAILARGGKLRLDLEPQSSRQTRIKHPQSVLVTGASGYLGTELVRQLVESGYNVRAFIRPLSRSGELKRLGVGLIYGDIREYEGLRTAAEGMDFVVHAAAALDGTRGFIHDVDVEGTRNVARAAVEAGADRVVYVSSVGVHDFLGMHDGYLVTEESPLEQSPQLRGSEAFGKRRAEDIALSNLNGRDPAWTIVRPALIFGNGRDLSSVLGRRMGNFAVNFSRRRNRMRLIHVRDVASAVIRIIQSEETRGRKYLLSHPDTLTVGEFEKAYLKRIEKGGIRVIYVPYVFARVGFQVLELARRVLGKTLGMNRRRLAYAYRSVQVDSTSVMRDTGWRPSNSLLEQLKDEVADQAGR